MFNNKLTLSTIACVNSFKNIAAYVCFQVYHVDSDVHPYPLSLCQNQTSIMNTVEGLYKNEYYTKIKAFFKGWAFESKPLKHVMTTPLLNAHQQVWVSRVLRYDPLYICPMSPLVWHAKEPLLFIDHECRVYFNICKPFTGNGVVPIWI